MMFLRSFFIGLISLVFCGLPFAMDWKKDFGAPLLKEGQNQFTGERLVEFKNIDDTKSLTENIRHLFYPSGTQDNHENILWKTIRAIMVGVLIFYLVWAGFRFVMDADNESEVKKNQMNLLYIVLGAGVIFLSTWVLGDALRLGSVEGVIDPNGNEINTGTTLLNRVENNIFVVILGFLKGFAFFLAVIMLVYYGYKMIIAFDKEDKIKTAKTGVLNVILALVFIKVIDFLYYIAQQKDFESQVNDFVLVVAKFFGYIFGILIVLVIIYIAFQFITGGEEGFKKGVTFLKNILIIGLVVFLFFLVLYQVFQDVV